MQAEQAADAMITQAQERKERAIAQALADRKLALENLRAPQLIEPTPGLSTPDLKRLTAIAKKNRSAAVRKILEEFHAAA